MTEKMVIGLIGKTVTGSIGITAFSIFAWIFQKKYKAQSRKNIWIFHLISALLSSSALLRLRINEFVSSKAQTQISRLKILFSILSPCVCCSRSI